MGLELGEGFFLVARHGGGNEGDLLVLSGSRPDLQQGSVEAVLGSASTTASLLSPFKKVDRRPLPPSSSAVVLSRRRLHVIINLEAIMPMRRPFYSSALGS
jgi:hypothetical protein